MLLLLSLLLLLLLLLFLVLYALRRSVESVPKKNRQSFTTGHIFPEKKEKRFIFWLPFFFASISVVVESVLDNSKDLNW